MISSHTLLGTHIDADDSELNARLKRIRFLLHPDRHMTLSAADHRLLATLTTAASDAAQGLKRQRRCRRDGRVQSLLSQMRRLRSFSTDHFVPPPATDHVYQCQIHVDQDDHVQRVECFMDGSPLSFDDWTPIHREAGRWRAQSGPQGRHIEPGRESLHGGHVPAADPDARTNEQHCEQTAQE